MTILKANDRHGKKILGIRLIALGLIGSAFLGLSAFSLRVTNKTKSEHLAEFAGTWQSEYKGKAFFTLQLKLTDGSLGGTCVHSAQLAWSMAN